MLPPVIPLAMCLFLFVHHSLMEIILGIGTNGSCKLVLYKLLPWYFEIHWNTIRAVGCKYKTWHIVLLDYSNLLYFFCFVFCRDACKALPKSLYRVFDLANSLAREEYESIINGIIIPHGATFTWVKGALLSCWLEEVSTVLLVGNFQDNFVKDAIFPHQSDINADRL